jgi:hypothetical protein
MAVSREHSQSTPESLFNSTFNIEPKPFSVAALENAIGGSGIYVRIEINPSLPWNSAQYAQLFPPSICRSEILRQIPVDETPLQSSLCHNAA